MRRPLASLAVATLAAVAAVPAGSSVDARGAEAAAPGIAIVSWRADRLESAVWRGGPARLSRVRVLAGARFATLSPTGAAVAYARLARDGLDLFVTGTYAGFEAKLAHVPGSRTTALAFAPDGRTIAFASPRGIELVANVHGSRPRLLPLPARWRGSRFDALAFSPDGALLAVSRTWGDGRAGTLRNELGVIGRDGTGARSLVRNPDPYSAQYRPTFSPDGRQLSFAAADGSLAAISPAGGRVLRLTSPRPPRSARTDDKPLFSRDGNWIAFTRSPGAGGSDVYVVRADGGGLRRLTATPLPPRGEPRTGSSALAWSPDGTRLLAFRRDHLALVDAATGESTLLARVGTRHAFGSALWR